MSDGGNITEARLPLRKLSEPELTEAVVDLQTRGLIQATALEWVEQLLARVVREESVHGLHDRLRAVSPGELTDSEALEAVRWALGKGPQPAWFPGLIGKQPKALS